VTHHRFRTAFIVFCTAIATIPGANAAGIPWAGSWDSAVAQASKNSKPIMVDLYTTWCVWCKRLDSDVYPNGKVVAATTAFVAVKLDAEKLGKDIATRNHVTGYPTILFTDASGALLGRIVGYEPPADFISSLKLVLADMKDVPSLEKKVKQNPSIRPGKKPTPSSLWTAPLHKPRTSPDVF